MYAIVFLSQLKLFYAAQGRIEIMLILVFSHMVHSLGSCRARRRVEFLPISVPGMTIPSSLASSDFSLLEGLVKSGGSSLHAQLFTAVDLPSAEDCSKHSEREFGEALSGKR